MADMMNEETRACAIVDKVTSSKFKRPSIKTPCVADRYHGTGQRIAEFSASASIAGALPGGLLSVTELADGHLQANLYRLERTHVFIEGYPAIPKAPGRMAYELDCAISPTYHDGAARKSWENLGDLERSSWEKNPTPRLPLQARSHIEAAARTMLAALREIIKDAPTDDPGEGDWSDGLDSAFACGLEAAHYEAARIARIAIAAAETAGITTA